MIKMRSSLRRPLKYDQTMPFLRHDLLRLTTALFGVSAFGTDLGLRIMEGLGLVAVT